MSTNWIAKLQGRAIGNSTRSYSQPENLPGELTQAYMNAYERLRILGKPAAYTTREIKELQTENAYLWTRIDHLESRLDKFETPRVLIEMLREHGLVAVLENENRDKTKSSLPHRWPLDR